MTDQPQEPRSDDKPDREHSAGYSSGLKDQAAKLLSRPPDGNTTATSFEKSETWQERDTRLGKQGFKRLDANNHEYYWRNDKGELMRDGQNMPIPAYHKYETVTGADGRPVQQLVWAPMVDSGLKSAPTSPTDVNASTEKTNSQKSKFLAEEIDEEELTFLEKLGKSREQLMAIKKEINEKGMDPYQMVTDLMKHNRVLGLGEVHGDAVMHRFGKDVMAQLKAAGATHLAIEVPTQDQVAVDRLLKKDKLTVEDLASLSDMSLISMNGPAYWDMIVAANKAGLEVVCVDQKQNLVDSKANKDNDRDKYMSQQIDKVLQEDKNNKIVYWVGNLHLKNGSDKKRGTSRAASDYLSENYPTATVLAESNDLFDWPIGGLTKDLKVPVGISTNNELGKLPSGENNPEMYERYKRHWKDWTNIIIFPPKPKQALQPAPA